MVREQEYEAPFDVEDDTAEAARYDAVDSATELHAVHEDTALEVHGDTARGEIGHAELGHDVAEDDRAADDAVLGEMESDPADADLIAAHAAWDDSSDDDAPAGADEAAWQSVAADAESVYTGPAEASGGETTELDQPFVGRWNQLVSSTNWEKGRIINQWRAALIEAGAPATQYSDEAWARRVGGVTASHVGRLRRVHDAFADTHASYPGLFWTHFLVALEWDDAPLWLEGAAQAGWSVATMRRQRWQANGGDEATRPQENDVVTTDLDEDFDPRAAADPLADAAGTQPAGSAGTQPAQGGGNARDYAEGTGGIGAGPASEGPDFGDEESLSAAGTDYASAVLPEPQPAGDAEPAAPLVQPFAGLPELPSDLADAVELLKLAILRHKTAEWKEVSAETVVRYLQAFGLLVEARGK